MNDSGWICVSFVSQWEWILNKISERASIVRTVKWIERDTETVDIERGGRDNELWWKSAKDEHKKNREIPQVGTWMSSNDPTSLCFLNCTNGMIYIGLDILDCKRMR